MSSTLGRFMVYLGLAEEPDPEDAPIVDDASAAPDGDGEPTNVRRLRSSVAPPHARTAGGALAIHVVVVEATAFDDAERIGSTYRAGQPVLFDLGGVDHETARRVLDFVAGVTYALRGQLSPAGHRSFLLVPSGVELPAEERRRLADMGYEVAS